MPEFGFWGVVAILLIIIILVGAGFVAGAVYTIACAVNSMSGEYFKQGKD